MTGEDHAERHGTEFDGAYWERHYRDHGAPGGAPPNPHLVAETADLPPGTALDAGCGEGGEAIWLAARGWHVTAVDVSATALQRARRNATGSGVTSPIDWLQADLTDWRPPERRYDLVCTHYVHVPHSPETLLRGLADAVAPGGTLLIVGHDPADRHSAAHTASPHAHLTAGTAAAVLDPAHWDVLVAETRTRTATAHDREITLHDSVVRARKHP